MEIYRNQLSAQSLGNLKMVKGKRLEGYFVDDREGKSSFEDVILRFHEFDLRVTIKERDNPTEINADISEMSAEPCTREFTEGQVGIRQLPDGGTEKLFRFAFPVGKIVRNVILMTDIDSEPMCFDDGREVFLEDVCGIALVMEGKTLVLDKNDSFTDIWRVSLQKGETPKFHDAAKSRIEEL